MCPPCVHGRRQAADNPFPSIPAAAHQAQLRWPPSLPNLMPCDFVLCMYACMYVKGSVFLPLAPQDLPELWRRIIIAAIWEIDLDMLQQVWAEMDYQLDFSHVTKSGYVDTCEAWKKMKNLSFHLRVACYNPFCHSSVSMSLNVSGNYE